MFCINSKRTTICGTSYEQLIILLEGKYGFLRKKSTRCTSISTEENYWISPFKILEVLILVSIVVTAFFSSQENDYSYIAYFYRCLMEYDKDGWS